MVGFCHVPRVTHRRCKYVLEVGPVQDGSRNIDQASIGDGL